MKWKSLKAQTKIQEEIYRDKNRRKDESSSNSQAEKTDFSQRCLKQDISGDPPAAMTKSEVNLQKH